MGLLVAQGLPQPSPSIQTTIPSLANLLRRFAGQLRSLRHGRQNVASRIVTVSAVGLVIVSPAVKKMAKKFIIIASSIRHL